MEHSKAIHRPEPSFLKQVLAGFFIGIGMMAPGLSGGAIAVVFGLYERITDVIAHFYRDIRANLRFAVPLAAGAGLGVALFSLLLSYAFEMYPLAIKSIFVGLMLGTLPSVCRAAVKEGFRLWYLIPLLLCCGGMLWLAALGEGTTLTTANRLTFPAGLIAGAMLGIGTIVPGMSASMLLMSFGMYRPVLQTLTRLDIPGMVPIGIGAAAFVLLFAKLIHYLYQKAYGLISFAVLGLLIGSILPAFPIPPGGWQFNQVCLMSALLMLAAGLLSYLLLTFKKE